MIISKEKLKYRIWMILERMLLKKNLVLSKVTPYRPNQILDISSEAWDYVRIFSLELVAHQIRENNIEGDVAELGVYQGNFARHINRAFPDRNFYLFDTFTGFTREDMDHDKAERLSEARETFADTNIKMVMGKMKYPEKVVIKKGNFPDSAAGLKRKFAFVSLDVDLYKPTYAGLKFFYPNLAKGGFIFIHDYNTPKYRGVKEALVAFSRETDIRFFPLCDLCGSVVVVK